MKYSHSDDPVFTGKPSFEGANIRTWIGFKHFLYLAEAATHEWTRSQGMSPRTLYLDHGLEFEVSRSSVQLPATVELGDDVSIHVTPRKGRRVEIDATVVRDNCTVPVMRGTMDLALIGEAPPGLPSSLQPFVCDGFPSEPTPSLSAPASAHVWDWKARYFLCRFSDRLQHSAFVRASEEGVDRLLESKGMSVGDFLRNRSWIPVVSRSRVQLHEPAHMDDHIQTRVWVDSVLRDTMFDVLLTSHAIRDGGEVLVASSRVLHGYAIADGPMAGQLAQLDPTLVHTLTE